MKRIITLALAAGLVLGATHGVKNAEAAEISVNGNFTTIGQWHDGFWEPEADDEYKQGISVHQRFQMDLGIKASDELSGKFRVRVPDNDQWGTTSQVPDGADSVFRVRQAYFDWKPTSDMSLRVGLQPITLPEYMGGGNPILDSDISGVNFSMQVSDMIGLSVQWLRPYSGTGVQSGGDVDMFNIIVPVNLGMAEVTPWASIIMLGDDSALSVGSGESEIGYALGLTSLVTMGEIEAGVDFLYTADTSENNAGLFLIDLHASYAMGMMTPTAFFWYGSGRDYSGNSADWDTYNPLNISGTWGGVMPYSYGFDNGFGFEDTLALYNADPFGSMGLGLALRDIKVVDNLTMGAHVAYVTGTNDYGTYNYTGVGDEYLGGDDSVIDLGFIAKYQLTQGLTAAFALGYVINSYDAAGNGGDKNDQNPYSVVLGMQYAF